MENGISILRIGNKIHKEAKKIAKENNMGLTEFTEEALSKLILRYKYSYNAFMKLVEKYPRLCLSKDYISNDLKDAPSKVLKEIMELIKSGEDNVFFFKNSKLSDAERYLKNNDRTLSKLVVIVTVNSDIKILEKAQTIPDRISELIKGNPKMFFIMRKNEALKDEPEVIMFLDFTPENLRELNNEAKKDKKNGDAEKENE